MSQASKPCPFCGENIRPEAIKCRFCGEILDQDAYERAASQESGSAPPAPAAAAQAGAAAPGTAPQGGDQVLFQASTSLFTAFGAIFWSLLIMAAALFAAFFPPDMLGTYAANPLVAKYFLPYRVLGAVVVVLVMLLVLVIKIAMIKATKYTITQDRLELENGLFSKAQDNLDLFRIKDLALNRSLFDRLVGIGTVAITTSDPSHPELPMYKIRGSKEAYALLKNVSLDADQRRRVIHYE